MTSHCTQRFKQTIQVVKVNLQIKVDEQAQFKVCLFIQTPSWRTFRKTAMYGTCSRMQIFKDTLSTY